MTARYASIRFSFFTLWEINKDLAEKLLDVLVCSIAEYFYSLFVLWLALRARQNTAQLVKIRSDTTRQNVLQDIFSKGFGWNLLTPDNIKFHSSSR